MKPSAINSVAGYLGWFFWNGVLMELDQLLCLEYSGEHLVGLDVLIEDLMSGGIGSPGAVKAVLGVHAYDMSRVVAHELRHFV